MLAMLAMYASGALPPLPVLRRASAFYLLEPWWVPLPTTISRMVLQRHTLRISAPKSIFACGAGSQFRSSPVEGGQDVSSNKGVRSAGMNRLRAA
jgi:hypothetical protein